MLGRKYTAQFNSVNIVALTAQDFFEILAPTKSVIIILDWSIFQTSDVGDAQEEILRIETVEGIGAVTTGALGTTVIARPSPGDSAFAGTVKANNTTRMAVGTGSLFTLPQHGWNVRSEYRQIYTPETCPIISPGDRWTLSLPVGPTDVLTAGGSVTFLAIGG